MLKILRTQYFSVIAVSAISLGGYYWAASRIKPAKEAKMLVSSFGSVPYSSGIHLNKQLLKNNAKRSLASLDLQHKVEPYSKGDLNGDGILSFLDLHYAEIMNYGQTAPEASKALTLKACDMNKDKKCNQKDMDLIAKKYVANTGDLSGDGVLSDEDLILAQRIVEKKEERNSRISLLKLVLNGSRDSVATAKDLVKLEKKLPK